MARRYKVEGTKSYLVGSIFLALLCVWAIRDGWFPSGSKIEMHGLPSAPNDGDHFYPFNRSLTFLSGIGSVVCAIVHRFVK
jgi:hypothetical protein